MRSKVQIQQDIDAAIQKRETILARAEALGKDRQAIAVEVEKHKKAVAKAYLDEKEPVDEIAALTQANLKLEGMDQAVRQIDQIVKEISEQNRKLLEEFYDEDMQRLAGEAGDFTLQALSLVHQVESAIELLHRRLLAIQEIELSIGRSRDDAPANIMALRVLHAQLSNLFRFNAIAPSRLELIETPYAAFLADLKKKHK